MRWSGVPRCLIGLRSRALHASCDLVPDCIRRAQRVCSLRCKLDEWGVMQTVDRLFTVLIVLSGIGSTVLIAVAVFSF